jgi:multisubunit Na+/H+ antiporter MnhF subunit
MWGGRSVVHFISQVLLLLPSRTADLLNTLIYLGYTFLIYFHIKGTKENSISLFIIINLAIWFLEPVFGDTILWITGAANYLWGTFFILLFLLPYRLYEGKKLNTCKQAIYPVLAFLFGLLAGWTNENTAIAMIFIVILFLFYFRSHKWQIPVWAIVGLIGAIIGFVIMIIAPGNYARGGDSMSLSLYTIGYRLFMWTLTFFYYSGNPLLISLLLIILYSHFPGKNKKENTKLIFIYGIAAIVAVYAMLVSPSFPRRALFGAVTFLIIASGICIYNFDYKNSFLKQIKLSVIFIALIGFIFTFYLSSKDLNSYRNMVTQREETIKKAKSQGLSSCEFERNNGSFYIHGEDPYSEVLMSRYYDINIKLRN